MLNLIVDWDRDAKLYESLKIKDIADLVGKEVEWYWFLHEKLERNLVELMRQERLVVHWGDGEIVGFQEVGKSYMCYRR